MNKQRIICAFLFVFLLGSPPSSSAQVFIEDGKVKMSVKPGENRAGKLTLHNTSDKDVNMKVYWEDFTYVPPYDGSKEFSPKGSVDNSAGDWVNVNTGRLMFGPYAKRTLNYTVNVPDEIREGHYGVLFFENEEKQFDTAKGINVVTRVGCLFFIEPEFKVKDVDIAGYQLTSAGLSARFTNQGNVILIPDGTFYIIDQEGTVFDRGEMDKIYLPPSKTADYHLAFNRELAPGSYTLVMTIKLEDNDVIVREIDFEKGSSSDYTITQIRD